MNKLRAVLLSGVFLLMIAAPRAHGQTVEDIIAKHIEALGGKEKLQSIHSVYLEGVAVMQNGAEIDSKTWKVKDKLYRQEITTPMGNIVVIVTPQKGWSLNPRSGGSYAPLPDEQLKTMQSQLDPAGPFVDYVAKGSKAELLGKDTIGGKECYKIRLTPASGQPITYSLDVQTYYILRETRKGGGTMGGGGGGGGGHRGGNADGEFNIDFGDYQKTTDGYVFPYTIITGSFGAKTSVEKLEVNKPVDDATLSKPGN
ncbi:MAG TPA: hypothetical protein VNS58_28910 [Puia sp.]|nr:hypothetical protein [Puia sp.]